MKLANMRELGVHCLIAYCLNDTCRHQALNDVSSVRPQFNITPARRNKIMLTHTQAADAAPYQFRKFRERLASTSTS